MQAFNKIGFHGGGRRPATGLLDWMKTLNSAEIPFFFAAPDFTSGLLEAQAIARDSDTDHTLVYRSPSGELEPNLEQDPAEAALDHWRAQKAAFPDELDPKLTWVEPVQFSAVTEATSNWVGKFAVAMADLTLDEGYKLAAFGFGHGQPPISTWGKSGMVRYLQLCAQHPDRLAISTQEFSLKTDDIWFMRSEKVGRFNFAYQLCDTLNISYPTTLITAFGWTADRAPKSVDSAVADIKSVADLYAQYPSIRGAALWSLGTRNYLARQIRKLIEPVTELTLATRFAVNQSKGFSPAPMTASVASILPSQMANARFVSDLTIPDDIELPLGEPFEKQWLVENNGDVAWGDGFKLVHVGGERMTGLSEIDLPATKVGEKQVIAIEFTVPNKTGTHYSDWRFRDANGKLFGDILFTRIAAVQPTPSGTPDSRFLADVTIPDDSLLDGGETFTKTWRVKNVGSRPWSSAMSLRFTGGTAMTAEVSQPLPDVAPGGEADISLKLVAPAVPGTYFGDWRMFDESGDPFGDTVFVRIVVPAAAGSTLVEPISQRDPLWADKRLGHAGSPKTIGEWGCLLTCFAMTANALGENTNPSQLNDAMLSRGGFLNLYLTKWNALGDVYRNIVYGGKYSPRGDLLDIIDNSLAEGRPVSVQVDFTRTTPYGENDQHWVLIVAKDGDDYRINDPWLWPPQEASLKQRYGRTGRPIQDAIMSAILYRTVRTTPPVVEPPVPAPKPSVAALQTGMNVNPDAPFSNPVDSDDLKGMDWVRFVFKLDARVELSERGDMQAAFRQYEPIVRKYKNQGTKSLIIINQETIWGIAPWTGNGNWQSYGNQLAEATAEIAKRFSRFGDDVAYQIWNEGDKPNNPASVFVEPETFAKILQPVAAAIRENAPDSQIVFNGMATGPETAVDYLKRCRTACGGTLPVDAVGIHPYTRWATRAPFDWGDRYGTIGQALEVYARELPDMKLWITEVGVAADNEIGSEHYAGIADYLVDMYQHIGERYATQVPVLIWFAWSDWMRNAGMVTKDGTRKDLVYNAFRRVRNREIW